MSNKRRALDSAVLSIQQRYGAQSLHRGADRASAPPHVATGFAALDAATGCGGAPLGAVTLLSGEGTSGKVTLAYETLANAQAGGRYMAALVDLTHNADADYLARCGVRLDRLLLARPETPIQAAALVGDLVRSRRVRLVLLDSVAELLADPASARAFNAGLPMLIGELRAASCTLICIDDPIPPWRALAPWLPSRRRALEQQAALHVELRREAWLEQDGMLVGYRALARVRRSRWRHDQPVVTVEMRYNGTVTAVDTW